MTEGTVGSTGVSLAMVASAVGCSCFVAMPDDAAIEKSQVRVLQHWRPSPLLLITPYG